jgi:hypothetical protein
VQATTRRRGARPPRRSRFSQQTATAGEWGACPPRARRSDFLEPGLSVFQGASPAPAPHNFCGAALDRDAHHPPTASVTLQNRPRPVLSPPAAPALPAPRLPRRCARAPLVCGLLCGGGRVKANTPPRLALRAVVSVGCGYVRPPRRRPARGGGAGRAGVRRCQRRCQRPHAGCANRGFGVQVARAVA